MQPQKYSKNSIQEMPVTKPGTTVNPIEPPEQMTFNQLCECINKFFSTREYEVKQGFKHGYGCIVGEDFTNIDLLCNLNEMIYNYSNSNENLTKQDRVNLNNLCKGVQQVTKSLEQYNVSSQIDQILISKLMGYILKITRNYFHDRH